MDNLINISNKKHRFNKTIIADEYMVLGKVNDKMEMMTNLDPEDLLIFLMPILNELGERFNWFNDNYYCDNSLMYHN